MRTIKLTNSNKIIKVDDEDYPVLSRLKWYESDSGYAITDSPVKHIKMHKLLVGPIPNRSVVDHINRDKLDNRKENLRVVSQRDNVMNSDKFDNSKYFYYDTRRNNWVVDARPFGVSYMVVPNPTVAARVVKRLKLGFPKDIALSESLNPTISISNWKAHDITYSDYKKSKGNNTTIKKMRRISRRGPAKKHLEIIKADSEEQAIEVKTNN